MAAPTAVVVRGARLNKTEAAKLTHAIRTSAVHLWLLVTEAHDRRAWQALGYPTWRAYVTAELCMSESRSYQLVDTGRVVRLAQQVLGLDPNTLELAPTARETARAKAHLPELRRALRAQVKAGLDPADALRAAIKGLPAAVPEPRQEEVPAPPKTRRPSVPAGAKVCPRCDGLGYV